MIPATRSLHADLILYNASLWLDDAAAPPHHTALAVGAGRILAIGDDADLRALAGPATRMVDAEGNTVLPGLTDSHIHFTDWARTLRALPIADTTSLADLLARLAARAAASPEGEWIVARGWNEARWGADRFPTAADLDAATGPARPALLFRSDMHSAVANAAALVAAGIGPATPNPPQGVIDRDAAGIPTGVLRESAIDLVMAVVPPVPEADLLEIMVAGAEVLNRLGITSVHDQRVWSGDDGPRALRRWQALRAAQRLNLRVACNVAFHDLEPFAAAGLASGFGDDFLRLGHVKLFADGSLGSRTAWMLRPFEPAYPGEPPTCGVVVTEPEAMRDAFRRAIAAGFPVSIHAIGDRANREVLDAFADVLAAPPARLDGLDRPLPAPHRIEHVQIIDPADVKRLAPLNLTASLQPLHALDDREIADALLGARADTAYTFRTLLEAGTRLAFGSDAPVANPDPWLGLHAAVVRARLGGAPWRPAQRIPLNAALRAYTANAAAAAGWERTFGRLRPGLAADLILLDRNLAALHAEEMHDGALAATQVRLTLLDGNIVWQA